MQLQIASDVGPATEHQIVAWERELGVVLPSDYRGFISKYNGGRPRVSTERAGDVVFRIRWDGQDWASEYSQAFLQGFYSLDGESAFAWAVAAEQLLEDRRVPEDLLPIAFDRGSNQILLGIRGLHRGRVYFWAKDFEAEAGIEGPGYGNVGFVADAFGDFLVMLRPAGS